MFKYISKKFDTENSGSIGVSSTKDRIVVKVCTPSNNVNAEIALGYGEALVFAYEVIATVNSTKADTKE